MLASRFELFSLPGRSLALAVCRRPKTTLVFGLFFLLIIPAVAIYYYWSYHHLWAARHAFRLDMLPEANTRLASYLESKPNDLEGHFLASRINRLLGKFR